MSEPLRVQDLGEQGLLERLQRFCPADLVGDDGAVLPAPRDRELVITTDVLVDGVHFSDRTTPPESVGWRAAAANLSDLAAMGALPVGITVGLGLPGPTRVEWVERLYAGLTACLQTDQTPIVGGDVVRSPVLTVAITALGGVPPQRIIRRSTAQPGDAIVVTGAHGASRAGLELLLHPEAGTALRDADRRALIRAHQQPTPRLDIIRYLHSLPPLAIAGMDSSDGLADAVLQVCRLSGVGARLDQPLPMPPVFREWLLPAQQRAWTLYGGEDFELVLCLEPAPAQALVQQVGGAIVGEITAEPGVWLVEGSNRTPLALAQGFQHFTAS